MNKNETLFAELVRQNRSTIYTVCYMFSNDNDEVADMFQEVLIRLWNGMETYNGRCDIKTWIYRVALNTCITIDKSKKRHTRLKLEMDTNYFSHNDTKSEQARILHQRICRLQPLDRAIVLLWLEDINYNEIAAIVGISVKTVSVRLVRIREKLKRMNTNENE